MLNLYLLLRVNVRQCPYLIPHDGQVALQVLYLVHALELQVLAHEREGLDRLLVLLTLTPQLLLEHLYTVLQISDLILLELEFREPLGLTKRVYILVDGA